MITNQQRSDTTQLLGLSASTQPWPPGPCYATSAAHGAIQGPEADTSPGPPVSTALQRSTNDIGNTEDITAGLTARLLHESLAGQRLGTESQGCMYTLCGIRSSPRRRRNNHGRIEVKAFSSLVTRMFSDCLGFGKNLTLPSDQPPPSMAG
ncbi:hypothetical protein BD289DRAFT_286306 [Coniella lustricola]|uniref:Uncharacterized protein n=1 Tax=Coniella lustricola TaxID=2025994 RepID=A0A2T3A5R0_9PEZI|nr:hypothetical protein BD289DRAFT_286306 [Coniella lustricola]